MGLALTQGVLKSPDLATIVGVLPWSNMPGQFHTVFESSEYQFRKCLKQHHLPVLKADSVNGFDFMQMMVDLKPDLVLVGSWGEIFQSHVLQTPDTAFINCHPSLLPLHRGANPYVFTILAGDTEAGVTFHLMDEGIDTGPIVLQRQLAVNPEETGGSLRDRCATLAKEAVPALLQQVASQALNPIAQPQNGDYDRISPNIGRIHWQDTPATIDQKMRGILPWFDNLATCGRLTVAFRYGRVVARPAWLTSHADERPGLILKSGFNGIWVSLGDIQPCVLLREAYLFYGPSIVWRLIMPWILKPGRYLT